MIKTIYFFAQREEGPFLSKQEAVKVKDAIIEDLLGGEKPDEYQQQYIDEAFELVPVKKEIWVTTAPESYDYTSYTVELGREGNLRVVGLDPERKDFQIGRYQSGMHFVTPYGSDNHKYYLEVMSKR